MIDYKSVIRRFKGKGGKVIFFLGLAGILLIYLSSMFPHSEDKSARTDTVDSASAYCAELEDKVRALVSGITGSKNISVVITLDSGKQYIYADEGRTTTTDDSDDRQQSYTIIKSADGEENGLLVTEYLPQVRGVAIVCDALSGEAKERVCSAVMAALDISSKKIYVTQYAY